MADTVSVIIPAYNAAAHIARAVDSVLAQSHPALEILIVDDGSKDRTAEVVEAMPPPVRLIRKPNGGPASARNLGALQAKGDWLALLDADDWWLPEKLREQLALATEPNIGMIHCLPDHRNDQVPDRLTFEHLWDRNWIINSSVLIRRSVFQALGGFNEAKELISVEDYNFWVRVAASDSIIRTCPRVLVHYTRGIGISSNSERFMKASLFNVEDLGQKLNLSREMVRHKQTRVLFEFGGKALFERDLPVARRLFWRAFSQEPNMRHAARLLASAAPQQVLDIRRNTIRLLERSRSAPSPESGQTNGPNEDGWQIDPAHMRASIIDPAFHTPARIDALKRPVLITTIDAEEDFDWTRPLSRAFTDVTSMRSQHLAHRIFELYGVVPTYMVDHPVASQDEGRAPLKELLQGGHCEIGAQLHPWVTPPFIESVSPRNSYHGNLPAALEFSKVQVLTGELQAAFGITPRAFRAGRYGAGPNTGNILRHFGYQADMSVVPCWSFDDQGGPDFRRMTAHPYWIDREQTILELPISAAFVGMATALPSWMTARMFGRRSESVGIPSVMARLGLLERIKLTPEGIAIDEAQRLVRHMADHGHKVFVLTYHSPSLEPGNTPYVRTQADLEAFLRWLDAFYAFFTEEIGGVCATWSSVRDDLRASERR